MTGYINGVIYGRNETAFLVEAGKFVAFGNDTEIQEKLGWQDVVIDLKGQFVLPGFISNGMHILQDGKYAYVRTLANAKTRQDISNLINSCNDTFVVLYGYDPETMETLNRVSLDVMDDTRGVVIFTKDEEIAILNSKAFEIIDPSTLEEEENEGVIRSEGLNEIKKYVAINDLKMIEKFFKKGLEKLPQYGVTSAVSSDFLATSLDHKPVLTTLRKLAYEQDLPLHLYEDFAFENAQAFSRFLDEGYGQFIYEENLHFNHLSLIADGTHLTHTASLQEAYQDETKHYGQLHYTDEELTIYMKLANNFNTGITIEANGDAAIDQVLDMYGDVMYEENPLKDTIAPFLTINDSQLQKLIDLKLITQVKPSAYLQFNLLHQRIGSYAGIVYPLKTLVENVMCIGIASSGNVIQEIHHAVNRQDTQAISVEQAITLFTSNAAQALVIHDTTGHLQEGYDADFVVLDQNITTIEPQNIKDTEVTLTVSNGNTTYKKEIFA